MRKINKNKQPLVSVVMPVYNAGGFLVESIRSILRQTYKNLEFIIVDDASTDNSLSIIRKFRKKDKRIKLIRNEINLGVSETVKKAILKAKGDFIARMDADDIAEPERIKKQVDYLLANPKTVAIGGQCILIDKNNRVIGEKKFPKSFKDIYRYIFTFVPLQQPTLMIAKRRLPKDFEYYRDGANTAEEVELLFKLFQYGKVENLSDNLLKYRIHGKNTSLKSLRQTFLLTLFSRFKAIFEYEYQPTITGIVATILQTLIVLFLPQKLVFLMYKKIRGFNFERAKKTFRLKPVRIFVYKKIRPRYLRFLGV